MPSLMANKGTIMRRRIEKLPKRSSCKYLTFQHAISLALAHLRFGRLIWNLNCYLRNTFFHLVTSLPPNSALVVSKPTLLHSYCPSASNTFCRASQGHFLVAPLAAEEIFSFSKLGPIYELIGWETTIPLMYLGIITDGVVDQSVVSKAQNPRG